MIASIDVPALVRGLVVALVITVPIGVVFNLVVDDPDDAATPAVLLTSLAVLLGLAAGAAVAAHEQRHGLPLAHGTITALLALGAVTLLSFVVGDGVGGAAFVSNLLLTLIMGTVGGIVGGRLRTRRT